MCCFNEPTREPRNTRILISRTRKGRQLTIYQNVLRAENTKDAKQNAMVLPFPRTTKTQVELLDLSKHASLLDDLHALFPVLRDYESDAESDSAPKSKSSKKVLKVHSVGAYDISIAYSLKELKKVNTKVFKLSENLQEVFEEYYPSGFGFLICAFNPMKGIDGHPIAYVHDIGSTGLFVPTRHEHGGGDRAHENFDHVIFTLNVGANHRAGRKYLGQIKKVRDLLGAVEPISAIIPKQFIVRMLEIKGRHENEDMVFPIAEDEELDAEFAEQERVAEKYMKEWEMDSDSE